MGQRETEVLHQGTGAMGQDPKRCVTSIEVLVPRKNGNRQGIAFLDGIRFVIYNALAGPR